MKFLILHNNGVSVHDIVVSELLVVALGLDGPVWIVQGLRISLDTNIVVRYRVVST